MAQRSDVVFRTALADRLAAQALTPAQQPIQSPLEGLANMGNQIAQAYGARNIRRGVEADNSARAQELARALAGGDTNKEAQLTTFGGDPQGLQALQAAYAKRLIGDPVERFEPITDDKGNVIAQRNVVTGQVTADPRAPKPRDSKLMTPEEEAQAIRVAKAKKDGGGGPFEGTGMEAQALNVLLDPNADPASPVYRAAYMRTAQPKVTMDPNTGMLTTISPDMSAFRKPGAMPTEAPAGRIPTVTPPPVGGEAVAADSAIKLPGATVTQIPGAAPGKFNDTQGKAAGFADRMATAEGILENVETQGANWMGRKLEDVWGGNYLQSDAYQKFEQARRNFINAQLRRESGAVINPDEFKNADRQYFPVPGDSPSVIAQKRQNRADAIAAMQRDAGPSYKPQPPRGPKPRGANDVPPPPPGFRVIQ